MVQFYFTVMGVNYTGTKEKDGAKNYYTANPQELYNSGREASPFNAVVFGHSDNIAELNIHSDSQLNNEVGAVGVCRNLAVEEGISPDRVSVQQKNSGRNYSGNSIYNSYICMK